LTGGGQGQFALLVKQLLYFDRWGSGAEAGWVDVALPREIPQELPEYVPDVLLVLLLNGLDTL
jgi:hypothetical protein